MDFLAVLWKIAGTIGALCVIAFLAIILSALIKAALGQWKEKEGKNGR